MASNVLSVSHMRAAFITGFGGEDIFEFTNEFPVPNIKKDEVLVKVKCCAISKYDLMVRQGSESLFERTSDSHGIVLGYEICGEVYRVGKEVSESKHFELGDHVVGFIPLDTNRGGYAEYTVVHYTNIVLKPLSVSYEQAAASLLGGLRAYTSLHYQLKLFSGESILICDGASGENFMALQLARVWGAKVFTTATNQDQVSYLQQNTRGITKIILLDGTTSLVNEIMEETGGLGVDAILDNLGSTRKQGYTKKELEQVLGVFGKWATTDSSLQLDPPESKKLYIKNNSLSFVFEHSWLLSSTQIGRYLHILKELMQKLDNQELKAPKTITFQLEKIKEAHIYQQTKNVNGERIVINI